MKTELVKVPIYDVNIRLIQLNDQDTWNDLHRVIKKYDIDEDLKDWLSSNISRHAKNGGITCRRLSSHELFIVFFPFTTDDRLIEVYDHEKRHAEDRILNFCGINDIEAAAYLAGFLGVKFKNFIYNVVQKSKPNT